MNTFNEVDPTAIGQPKVSGSLTATALVTVTLVDTLAGAQIAIVRIDSMDLDATGQIADQLKGRPTAAHDAQGATARALLVRGRLAGLPRLSDSTNPALSPITQAIGVLFPVVRRDAKVGQTWADTTHINNANASLKQTGEVIVTWHVTGVEPGGAVVLEGVSTQNTKLDDIVHGQTLANSGRSTQHMTLGPNGPVQRASVESSSTTTITGPFTGSIPGKTTASITITPIP